MESWTIVTRTRTASGIDILQQHMQGGLSSTMPIVEMKHYLLAKKSNATRLILLNCISSAAEDNMNELIHRGDGQEH
jgi:hypothetical protein